VKGDASGRKYVFFLNKGPQKKFKKKEGGKSRVQEEKRRQKAKTSEKRGKMFRGGLALR